MIKYHFNSDKLDRRRELFKNQDCEEYQFFVTYFFYQSTQGRWRGVLHHVCGQHEWMDLYFSSPFCEHEEMEEPTDGKTLLESGSPPHDAMSSKWWPW